MMKEMGHLRVAMMESNLQEFDLENKTYQEAYETLSHCSFEILYENRTSVLTLFQRGLYENALKWAPKMLAKFLDPIIVAFAVHDACDLSKRDYAWLDLEGDGQIAGSAWTRNGGDEVLSLAGQLLRKHLEKYVLDAYDRQTRDDMARVWDAQLRLLECSICGETSLDRKPILFDKDVIRSWACSNCGHHVVVQADLIEYLQGDHSNINER
jgi:DNA-directed RNA polymerase subunit RPC12/RpoP